MSMNSDSKDSNTSTPMRRIKSFVLRIGRLTKGQQIAMDTLWPTYGLHIKDGSINGGAIFGSEETPLVLEIGFGMGDSLVTMAKNEPEKGFIGIEVHTPGVGAMLIHMREQGVDNIRTYNEDAVEVLDRCIPDNSLERVQIYFPDPWHKRRHNKRRIVQIEFIQQLRKKLRLGGKIHLATDWEDYAKHMLKVMLSSEGFTNTAADNTYIPRPDYRPLTKFEQRGLRLGHGVWDLVFEKVS